MLSEQNRPVRKWPGLDVLRAVAIGLVLILHYPARLPEFWDQIVFQIRLVGWGGVDLFFVLSGFLIAHLLFQEYSACGRIDVVRFWTRRAFKIYPSLYFLIALSASGALALQTNLTIGKIFAELCFFQNYLPHLWQHTWSLAVEEHFYILIALIFVLPKTATVVRCWPLVVAGVLCACLAARILTNGPFSYERQLYPTHLRIDSLFAGTLVAYFYYFHRETTRDFLRRSRWKFLIIGCALVRLGFWGRLEDSRFVQTFGLTLLSSGCAIFVALTVYGCFSFMPPGRLGQAVVLVGRISYGVYLWHMAILQGIERYSSSLVGGFAGLAIYLTFSITAGFLSTRLVEDPLLRLRNRFFPRRQAVMAGAEIRESNI
jgi:peptidoglycan/LPS O-acetylase OafA/YrhL